MTATITRIRRPLSNAVHKIQLYLQPLRDRPLPHRARNRNRSCQLIWYINRSTQNVLDMRCSARHGPVSTFLNSCFQIRRDTVEGVKDYRHAEMSFDLEGDGIVVTGAARGIGLAVFAASSPRSAAACPAGIWTVRRFKAT